MSQVAGEIPTSYPSISLESDFVSPYPVFADWYLVGVLWFANVFAFIDRQSLPLLVIPIERNLGISDTEMSLLIGLAFAIVFTGLGIPAGILIDRMRRKWLITGGIAVWSVATASCGLASSFAGLFVGRMGVGVGEAVFPPGAVAMMKDAFNPTWRSRAIGFWSSGATVGAGIALLGGGAILGLVSGKASVGLPLIGEVRPWQLVLIVAGLLGLCVAALMVTIREPERKEAQTADVPSLRDTSRYLGNKWRIFVPLMLVDIAGSIVMFSFPAWTPTFLGRVWGLSRPEIGLLYGLLMIALAPTGQCLAGIAVSELSKSRRGDAAAIAGVIICAILLIPAVLLALSSSLVMVWILVGIYTFVSPSIFTVATVAVTGLTPPSMMGKVAGLHFFLFNLLGFAFGVMLVALVSDRVFSGVAAIGDAMSTVIGIFDLVAIASFFILAKCVRTPTP